MTSVFVTSDLLFLSSSLLSSSLLPFSSLSSLLSLSLPLSLFSLSLSLSLLRLRDKRERTRGAKVTLDHLHVIVFHNVLDVHRAGDLESLSDLLAHLNEARVKLRRDGVRGKNLERKRNE
jgi:hypothetical protein